MKLFEQIKQDQLTARKENQPVVRALLTTIIGEAQTKAKNEGVEVLPDDKMTELLKKFHKNNSDYLEQKKDMPIDKWITLLAERDILERYLPKQLTEEELELTIRTVVMSSREPTKGQIMKYLKEFHNGCYDGKTAGRLVDKVLNG